MKCVNKLIIGNLNINSIRNKFDQLKDIIQDKVDVLVLTETKLDESFPTSQFLLPGFSKPYRFDRDKHGGGILLYVREDIPSKLLNSYTLPKDVEAIFIELNLRKVKWLISGLYHPPSQSDNYFFQTVSDALDKYRQKYPKFLLCGDFNAEISELCFTNFLQKHDAGSIIRENTCFKSITNPSCIDLFVTNSPHSFQNSSALATGLSDFHKMVVTVLKNTFAKAKPQTISYRDYKNFNTEVFKDELKHDLRSNQRDCEYSNFEAIFLRVLNKHAPLKQKILRSNQVPYMSKTLRKAIMKRSELATKYYKHKTDLALKNFKRQRNYCSRLYKRERRRYYESLDISKITDNKTFWKTVKPFLSDKGSKSSKITLVNGAEIVSDPKALSDCFSSFYKNAVNGLGIDNDIFDFVNDTSNINDPIDAAIVKFQNHPSINAINQRLQHLSDQNRFAFSFINCDVMEKEILKLNSSKRVTFCNIPPSHLKDTIDVCTPILHGIWNHELVSKCTFPADLKLADVSPVYKKDDAVIVSNYRPVSVLPTVSKIFERLMQTQIVEYIDKYLSDFMCGFRKGINTQTALLSLLENIKVSCDKKGYGAALLMDLSKAFDTINHQLLIAKLHAYGFSKNALRLLNTYLKDRWQRVKVESSFSSWTELICGVPQGSVLGPLLFNIYLNDLFFLLQDIGVCNFADDTTPYVCGKNLESVLQKLEVNCEKALEWFRYNFMKLNPDKCHLLVSGFKHERVFIKLENELIWEDLAVKLLGVTIDRELKFDKHVTNICEKANRKLCALIRLSPFLSLKKRRILFKSFFESQFRYCPLTWMLHNKASSEKINQLHLRALRFVYNDYQSTFEELLLLDKSCSVHDTNIQLLASEVFKYVHGLSPRL